MKESLYLFLFIVLENVINKTNLFLHIFYIFGNELNKIYIMYTLLNTLTNNSESFLVVFQNSLKLRLMVFFEAKLKCRMFFNNNY